MGTRRLIRPKYDEAQLLRIQGFLEQSQKRIKELEAKELLTRQEMYELEQCHYDVKRAKKALGDNGRGEANT